MNNFKKQFKKIYRSFAAVRFIYGYYYYYSERLTGCHKEKKHFKKIKGYELNLKDPLTFCEKIVWKKMNDRNPLITITSDKYLVRQYIEDRLGTERTAALFIRQLYVTNQPATIPFDDLPEKFVVKANHGSGWNLFVDQSTDAQKDVIEQCSRWLSTSYGHIRNEWGYVNIPRRIIIEELLLDEDGELPKSFKFYMFHGTCRYIRVTYHFTGTPSSSFDPDWKYLPIMNKGGYGPQIEKPENFNQMISIAEALSKDFDFVRVDLYNVHGKIYFGELTHYPNAGRVIIPYDFDLELGAEWKLPHNS